MDEKIRKNWLGDAQYVNHQIHKKEIGYILECKDVTDILTDFTKCLKESEKYLSEKCTNGICKIEDVNDVFLKFIEGGKGVKIPPDLQKLIDEQKHEEHLKQYLYGLVGHMHSVTQEISERYRTGMKKDLDIIAAHAIMNNAMIGSLNVLSESFINILFGIEKQIDYLGLNSVTKLRASVTNAQKNVKILAKDRENLIELIDCLREHLNYTVVFTRYIVLYFN